jgi:hypothetical protein
MGQLMFTTSETTAKLDAALAKAQGEIEHAVKDKTNPHFRSKYADLTSVWEACRAGLSKNGISVTQWPVHSTDGRLHIMTRLAHAGEWMMSHFSLPVQKQDAHGYASGTTYAKRIALSAAVGVVADEDDDGNAASAPRGSADLRAVEPPQATMAGRKNEAAGQRTASQYKADCIAALAKIKTSAELTAWSDAERDTLEKLEKASRDAHTAIMDKVAETMDRVSPKRGAAE